MLRKFTVVAALVGATLAIASPAALAAGSGATNSKDNDAGMRNGELTVHTTPAGVHPSLAAAKSACKAGISQHRWKSCGYEALSHGQYYLWGTV